MIYLQNRKPIDDRAALLQIFVRLMGLLWLFVMFDTGRQWFALSCTDGLLPVSQIADAARATYHHWAFFRVPSLLWISQSDSFALLLLGLGAFGGLMALTDRLATTGLVITYAVWLSFVNLGGDFFTQIWDTFLLELGFLTIFTSWLRNAGVGRKLVLTAIWLLNFRVWFSMGMVSLLYPNTPDFWWDTFSGFFANQPLPTPLAWHLDHWPDWVHRALGISLLVIQVLGPFLIVWHRTRGLAFWLFCAMSIIIQLMGNFGWMNIAAIIAAFPLLTGTRLGKHIGEFSLSRHLRWIRYLRVDPQYQRMRDWPRRGGAAILQFQMALQLTLIILLFFPIGNRDLNFLNYVAYRTEVTNWEGANGLKTTVLVPLRAGSNFRIANPYGLVKAFPPQRFEYVFEASASPTDGYWHPYPYRFKPGAGNPPMFIAPVSPRFEQQLYYEAQHQNFYRLNTFALHWGRPTCWTQRLVQALRAGQHPEQWFAGDPLHGKKPAALRMHIRQLRYTTPTERAQSNSMWHTTQVHTLDLSHPTSGLSCPLIPDTLYNRLSHPLPTFTP